MAVPAAPKKRVARKTVAKTTTAKKTTAKRVATKKTAAKKAATKKAASKKTTAKKTVAKKSSWFSLHIIKWFLNQIYFKKTYRIILMLITCLFKFIITNY